MKKLVIVFAIVIYFPFLNLSAKAFHLLLIGDTQDVQN